MRQSFTAAVATALLSSAVAPAAATPETVPPPARTDLTVTVTDLHSQSGNLVACLWRDKQGFPSCEKAKAARKLVLPVTGTRMQVTFPDVPPGRYAVTVHHDEDANGRMKHNFIGMPVEGVGISNNPGGMPGYEKSLLDVGEGTAVTVRMRYLFG